MPSSTPKTATKSPTTDRATLRRAVRGLHKVLSRNKQDVRSMVRLARAHRLLGNRAKAGRWYTVAIRFLSKRGQGLRALALAKERLSVAPEDQESLLELAALYAHTPGLARDETGRVVLPIERDVTTSVGRVPRYFTSTSAKALKVLDDVDEVERLHAALEAAFPLEPPEAKGKGTQGGGRKETAVLRKTEALSQSTPPPLPVDPEAKKGGKQALEGARLGSLPLLSSLGQRAFLTLMREMDRVTLEKGDLLFSEGEPARSFFLVAEGALDLRTQRGPQETSLARLTEGEVVGVLGLYSGRLRNATATAAKPCVLFEVTDRTLAHLVKEYPAAKVALSSFYRQRLLETFIAACPLLQDLPRDERLKLVACFEEARCAEGSNLVAPGEVQSSLHLVLRGSLDIEARVEGEQISRAHLQRGDFFGCIAALTGMPSRDRARWQEDGLVASLSHRSFNALLKEHPALRALPRVLGERGMMVSRTLFVGETGVPGFKPASPSE